MYIAIEGIKGSGKSTIIGKITLNSFPDMKRLQFFPITAPICSSHGLERIFNTQAGKYVNDKIIEQIFIERAHWHHANLSDKRGLILGDRSIATACVTRWGKWKDPYATIARVKEQHKAIISPDVIIWMKTTVENAESRIAQREKRSFRMQDEKLDNLLKTQDYYEELFQGGLFNKKVGKIQLIKLENQHSEEETASEILSIIKYYGSK
jgi:thymidylate kinase